MRSWPAVWRSVSTRATSASTSCSPASDRRRHELERPAGLPTDGSFELGLVHLGPALDVLLPGLVVELVVGPASGALVRPQTTSTSGRDVLRRGAAALARLAGACPFLVHGASGDLLGRVLVLAPFLEASLDVLVLALSLLAPRSRHWSLLLSRRWTA